MESRLDEGRANIIANAIRNDNFSVGSAPWLEEHHVERSEFEAFLNYAVDMARSRDAMEARHDEQGVVETEMTFGNYSGKPSDDFVKFNATVPVTSLTRMLTIAGERCHVYIYPAQMPLGFDLDGQMSLDTLTGEIN